MLGRMHTLPDSSLPTFPDLSSTRVTVLGDVMLDRYLWGDVARISPEAPVPVMRVTDKSFVAGGAGNVAANVVALGAQCTLIGLRGKDEAGQMLDDILTSAGVHTRLVYAPLRPTTTKTRLMARNQQLIRLDEEEDAALPEDSLYEHLYTLFCEAAEHSGAVILSDYGKGVLDPQLTQRVIQWCGERGKSVFVDPKGADWTKYARATCITPNAAEFAGWAGPLAAELDNEQGLARHAMRCVQELHLASLLVTRGAEGMSLFVGDGEAPLHVEARAREVFDVSGAGDTVIATMAATRAAGCSLDDAARLANEAAGVAVGKVGTKPVFADELRAALAAREGTPDERVAGADGWTEAAARVAAWRAGGQSVVFTNGCFDLLHPGHVSLLSAAAAEGDRLVVGLNTDASVRRLKGESRPVLAEADRAAILAALACVDMVVLFDQDTPLELIKTLRPDVLVKGADYAVHEVVGHDLVASWGGRVALVDLVAGKSTTSIVKRLRGDK